MKLLIKTACLFLVVLAGASSAFGQTPAKTAVVRLFEGPSSRRLFISYGNGKTETQETPGIIGKKDQSASTEQIQRVIDRLYTEGYHLVNSFSSGLGDAPATTLVFRKE